MKWIYGFAGLVLMIAGFAVASVRASKPSKSSPLVLWYVTNTVTVSGGGDTTPGNNTATDVTPIYAATPKNGKGNSNGKGAH